MKCHLRVTMFDLCLVPCMFVLLPIISSSQSACPEKCVCDLTRHVVNCQNAGLRHIPWNLPMPMELTSIDLSHNDIAEINAQIVYPNLRYLDLSNNRIRSIQADILRDLPKLEVLYLKDNHLRALVPGSLDGMVKLHHLDLSSNQLSGLSSAVFSELVSLEELNLSGNHLGNLTGSAFSGLSSLQFLSLEDNDLPGIPPDAFKELSALKSLNLGFNKIKILPTGAFSQLPMLRDLNLEVNSIAEISNSAFYDTDASTVSLLEKLDLRNNLIRNVPSTVLGRLENLESLELSQNPIREVPAGAFLGLRHLRTLQLNTMPVLETVREGAFVDLSNLQELEIHSNHKLNLIEAGAVQVVPQLRKVDLHANSLRSLDSQLLEWNALSLLDLRYNPWHCDCALAWLPQILKEQASNTTTYITQEVKCTSPEELAQALLVSLETRLFNAGSCSDDLVTVAMKPEKFQDHILIAIMCSIGGVLVVVIVILMCKYGKAYSRAYAPAMDQYVYRNPAKDDAENQRVPVIEGDMSMARNLRSSLSSTSGIGAPRPDRRLYRVRFADAADRHERREANGCGESSKS